MGRVGLSRLIAWVTLGLVLATALTGWLTLAVVLSVAAGIEERQTERLNEIQRTQEAVITELQGPSGEGAVPERADTFRSVRRAEAMIEQLCAATNGCDPSAVHAPDG